MTVITKNMSKYHWHTNFFLCRWLDVYKYDKNDSLQRGYQEYKKMSLNLQALPIELVYRILDHLSNAALFLSMINVSQRLNAIINAYQRFQVDYDL